MQSAWQTIQNIINGGDLSAETLTAWAQAASIVEASDDGFVSYDLNGVITTWNAGAESIFGYSAQEVIGRSIDFLIPPDRAHEGEAILERLRSLQRVQSFETVRVKKGGELIEDKVAGQDPRFLSRDFRPDLQRCCMVLILTNIA